MTPTTRLPFTSALIAMRLKRSSDQNVSASCDRLIAHFLSVSIMIKVPMQPKLKERRHKNVINRYRLSSQRGKSCTSWALILNLSGLLSRQAKL